MPVCHNNALNADSLNHGEEIGVKNFVPRDSRDQTVDFYKKKWYNAVSILYL